MNIDFCFFKSAIGGALDPSFFGALKSINGASVFIETGTYFGESVENMRHVFDQVVSVELDERLYVKAVERFLDNKNVKILKGDSATALRQALVDFGGAKNSVLWLDAHYSGEGTATSGENTPIVREIEIVDNVGGMNDIVLIDDIRMFRNVRSGFLHHEAISGYPNVVDVAKKLLACKQGFSSFIVGDMLIALPASLEGRYVVSDVVKAITALQLDSGISVEEQFEYEQVVANASGEERATLLSMPDLFRQQLEYGLGGEFCYWRGLIYENDHLDDLARVDFELARKCGINVPSRRPR